MWRARRVTYPNEILTHTQSVPDCILRKGNIWTPHISLAKHDMATYILFWGHCNHADIHTTIKHIVFSKTCKFSTRQNYRNTVGRQRHNHEEHRLTFWGRGTIAAISQTTFSNAFSWMKMYEFRFRFPWNVFPRFELNIHILALVQIIVWRRQGDKPLSGPMMVSLLMHTCVTRPQWVNRVN